MRWSKTVRSDDWIKTSQNTMNDSSSFMSFGAEETKQKAQGYYKMADGLREENN